MSWLGAIGGLLHLRRSAAYKPYAIFSHWRRPHLREIGKLLRLGVPEAFHNIGIRIEDDAIVTESGCELITRGVPVEADEIEALMRA